MTAKNDLEKDPARPGRRVETRLRERNAFAWLAAAPSLGEWLGDLWPDLLTLIVVGAIGLGLNASDAIGGKSRYFMIFNENSEFVNYEMGKPRQANIIPIWLAAVLAVLVPTISFALAQIRVHSLYDLHVAFWANISSIVLASVFQIFNKILIGGLRPHFFDVCQPRADLRPGDGAGYHGLYFTWEICSGPNPDYIQDALKSWPSGHTTVAFAGFVLLSLYLNGKLKVFSDERILVWKLFAFLAPILGAFLIAGAMVLDHSHHWWDVAGGVVIGTASAVASYRANYAAIWDHRFNHIPLTRSNGPWRRINLDGEERGGHFSREGTGHFAYSTASQDRFPDFAHGDSMRWEPAGAPGDAIAWDRSTAAKEPAGWNTHAEVKPWAAKLEEAEAAAKGANEAQAASPAAPQDGHSSIESTVQTAH
ncbi:phosphatidic acid phosphatase type 2/haloperoxidase [Schizophyllum commune]